MENPIIIIFGLITPHGLQVLAMPFTMPIGVMDHLEEMIISTQDRMVALMPLMMHQLLFIIGLQLELLLLSIIKLKNKL